MNSLAVCLLATIVCTLAQLPAQAQGPRRIPLSAEVLRKGDKSIILARTAASDLHAGRYEQAEAEARQAITMHILPGIDEEVLAAALDAQGKDVEALQTYCHVVEQLDAHPENIIPYALLLLKSGQWKKAAVTYETAVAKFPSYTSLAPVDYHFSPDVPEPMALAVAIHIERGRIYNAGSNWAGETQNTEAMAEYGKALQLAPDNTIANYYYGVGWQRLSPAECTKFVSAQQAKAALTKAVKMGKGPVKIAAQKALRMAINTK